MITAVLLALCWGAFAFGSVYPWAYWPLFIGAAAIGLAGLVPRRDQAERSGNTRPIAAALAIVAGCIALQLVPLPQRVILAVSPATDALLRQHDIGYAGGVTTWHSLSIEREATALALAAFVSLAAMLLGLARSLTPARLKMLVHGLAAIGLALAVVGVVQRSTGTLKIYGFWTPIHHPYQIYGPFVNHNHFAGWMVMAIPLVLAAAVGGLAYAADAIRPDWRSRLLWIDSADGYRLALTMTSVFAMGIALVLTMSRSGITVFAVTVLFIAIALLRRRAAGRGLRAIALATVAILAIAVFAWTGLEPIAHRFATGQSISGRLPGWLGAITIASAFPLFGSGLNTYKTAMLYHTVRTPREPYWDAAHNDYLQLVSEGGLLLAIPITIVVWLVGRRIICALRAERDAQVYWIRLGAAAGLIGIGLQALVDFSLQIPGNAALFAVLCAIAIHEPRTSSRAGSSITKKRFSVPSSDRGTP